VGIGRSKQTTRHYYNQSTQSFFETVFGDQIHPPMVDQPEYWFDPNKWKDGARLSSKQLIELAGLTVPQKILDVGCGIGGVARQLVIEFGHQVTAINKSDLQIKRAIELGNNGIQYCLMDAQVLAFADNTFDSAVCMNMSYHVDRKKLFKELSRVVRPGGILALDDWVTTDLTTTEIYNWLMTQWCPDGSYGFGSLKQYRSDLKLNQWREVAFLDLTNIGAKYLTNESIFQNAYNAFFNNAVNEFGKYGDITLSEMLINLAITGLLYREGMLKYIQMVAKNVA